MNNNDYKKYLTVQSLQLSRLKIQFRNVRDALQYSVLADEIIEVILDCDEKHDEFTRTNGYIVPLENQYNRFREDADSIMNFCRNFKEIRGY